MIHGKTTRILLLCMLLMVVCGCALRTQSPAGGGHASVGDTLVRVGQWCIVVGCIAIVGSAACRVLSFFPQTAIVGTLVGKWLAEAAIIGGLLVILGSGFVWLGVHSWLLFVVIALCALVVLVRYRQIILSFVGFDKKTPPA